MRCEVAAAPPKANEASVTNQTYPMGKLGTLNLTFPRDWNERSMLLNEGTTNLVMTFDAIQFTRTNQSAFEFVVELIPVAQINPLNPGIPLKSVLFERGQGELTNSVETKLDIKEFKTSAGRAWYFRVTDKRWANQPPPPGECKYLTQGYAECGPLVLSFHLVSNQPEADEPPAFQIIKDARITKP